MSLRDLGSLVSAFNNARLMPSGPERSRSCDSITRDVESHLDKVQASQGGQWTTLHHSVVASLASYLSSPTIATGSATTCSAATSTTTTTPTAASTASQSDASGSATVGEASSAAATVVFDGYGLTEGHRLVAALWHAISARKGEVPTDGAVAGVAKMAESQPLFLQNVARYCLRTWIAQDCLSLKQWRCLADHVAVINSMPNDNDTPKRTMWLENFGGYISARCSGPSLSQITGCLIGQCVGDAFGFPVEGQSREYTTLYAKEFIYTIDHVPTHARGDFAFGQFTDDSQLARELMISLCETGGIFNPQNYANRIAGMFTPPHYKIVGLGRTTEQAAANVLLGVPWHQSGSRTGHGNGSAMRAAPVGLFFHSHIEDLVQAAVDQSRITHALSVCNASAVAISAATRLALLPSPVDSHLFIANLARTVAPVDFSVSKAILALEECVNLSIDLAIPKVLASGEACGDKIRSDRNGISTSAVEAMLWALYSFLKSPDDYINCIGTAISGGGDVDTTAAMAGAICGAHVGVEKIPQLWRSKVNDRGDWTEDKLTALATRANSVIQHLHTETHSEP
ncbi:ADP-ribosylglycohydrolase family protein [Pelomyxa schiedti]|nr:ADP-ribosylglycohydrolase family protein [Pelomyxa schiedti]